MNQIALIFGITGQDGSFLADLLLSKGYEVHGCVRMSSSLQRSRIDHLYADSEIYTRRLFLHYVDITDGILVSALINDVEPTEVFFLAGQSHVGLSDQMPVMTIDTSINSLLVVINR